MKITAVVMASLMVLCVSAEAALPAADDVNSISSDIAKILIYGLPDGDDATSELVIAGDIAPAMAKEEIIGQWHKDEATLDDIIGRARKLAEAIEAYQGSDWETRYGKTGVWRNLKQQTAWALLMRCQTKYYLALIAESGRDLALRDIAGTLEAGQSEFGSRSMSLLLGRCYLGLEHPTEKETAKGESTLTSLVSGKERDSEWVAAVVELYKHGQVADVRLLEAAWRLTQTAGNLPQSDGLAVAIAAWEAGRGDWLEKEASLDFVGPAISRCVGGYGPGLPGRCILTITERLMKRDGVKWMGAYAAELAVWAALDDLDAHGKIVDAMGGVPEFRRGAVLYALGRKLEKTDPDKAVGLMLEGSRQMTGYRQWASAEYAAQSAYELFTADKSKCLLAKRSLSHFLSLNYGSVSGETEMRYYAVCQECGEAGEASMVLEKTASRGTGEYQRLAKYELAVKALKAESPADRTRALPLLDEVMAGGGALGRKARLLWCGEILESDANDGSRKVLAKLPAPMYLDADEMTLRFDALIRAGMIKQAAAEIRPEDYSGQCVYAEQAMTVVRRYLDMAEIYQDGADYRKTVENCRQTAMYCRRWMEGDAKYSATVAELEAMLLLCGPGQFDITDAHKLDSASSIPGTSESWDMVRCRARLLMAKEEWEQASVQWGRICERKIAESKGDARPWDWWRAKYYQLYCWSKGKDATKEELGRRVAVTLSSCGPVPPLWEKKLRAM